MQILNRQEMTAADQYTIQTLGIPGATLMESAAQAIVTAMLPRLSRKDRIVVLAGTGNNGGDGIAIARRLNNLGYDVALWLIPPVGKVKDAAKVHLDCYLRHGYTCQPFSDQIYTAIRHATVLVDAMLGVGMSGALREPYRTLIAAVNQSRAKVCAVDLPSGVSADGAAVSEAVQADWTMTVEYPKLSAFLYPAARYYGQLVVVDIGIPPAACQQAVWRQTWGAGEFTATLPKRRADVHKGSQGRCLVVGGSKTMLGAPIFAAKAAAAVGAGLLTAAVPEHLMPVMAAQLPETTYLSCQEEGGCLTEIHPPASADVIVAGMGLGRNNGAKQVVETLLRSNTNTLILDADGLYVLPELWHAADGRKGQLILTPHMGEMARLCRSSVEEVEQNRFEIARSFAMEHGVYLVLKGPYTIVTTPEGKQFVNLSGNAGLAKGGSGDVLSGMIAGMVAQDRRLQHAISNAVFLHGHVADRLVEHGMAIEAVTPTALIQELPFSFIHEA